MGVDLVCPKDGAPLALGDEAYACPTCGQRFPVERGVVRFMDATSDWYEGRYLHTMRYVPRSESPLFAWPLWLIPHGYVWDVRRFVPAGGTLLELGSGSGIAYFAKRFRVIGLDLSLSSLAKVAPLYDTCLMADALDGIPLPDGSVDGVVSSFVWEHIPPERQPALLAECRRVLKPGGRLVFLHDIDPQNPVYRKMRRDDPELFHEIFIVRDDHMGWQGAEANFAAFERGGFDVIACRGTERLVFSPATYDKVSHWPGWLGALGRFGERFRSGLPFHAWNAALRVFDETVGRLLPLDWSRIVVTTCQRR